MLIFISLFLFVPTRVLADCEISTNGDLGEPQPLIVNLNHTIRYPQRDDIVSFSSNESFILSCPGSCLQVLVESRKINFTQDEIVTCDYNKQFKISNETVIFYNFTCLKYPAELTRATGKTCEGLHQELEIGFTVNSTFITQITICFDNKTQATLYSHIQQIPFIRGRQSGFPRPSWNNNVFYQFGGNASSNDASGLLVRAKQIETLNKLIGCNNCSTTNPYINNSADLYLARGHLVAKADFVYGAQQRATFHMINVAPQWQTFNGVNWAYAEADARNLASDYDLMLEVYTGTYGVMTLPHVQTGDDVEIYMYVNDKGQREFPTPLLFWKYLYEPLTRSGIVLVGVNNPYIRNVSKAVICKDIYPSINWTMTFSRNDLVNGYMYACDPEDFRRTVTHMPKLPVKYLLTLNSTFNTTQNICVACSASLILLNTTFMILLLASLYVK